MNIMIVGASGMVGQGVLRECVAATDVQSIVSLVRRPSLGKSTKVQEIVLADFNAISTVSAQLTQIDACFFCAGGTSVGASEAEYTRVTYDLTLNVATVLGSANPRMTFLYVSGAGTDSSTQGRFMWARVKGRTENALQRLPFKAAYMLRPGMIQPMHGIRSKTGWYNAIYAIAAPIIPLLQKLLPQYVTTTEVLGRAMLGIARHGFERPILESRDINALGSRPK
jgi:uncharacterized protein YbjT (DUF2867 family)